jgi:hypothetical protein
MAVSSSNQAMLPCPTSCLFAADAAADISTHACHCPQLLLLLLLLLLFLLLLLLLLLRKEPYLWTSLPGSPPHTLETTRCHSGGPPPPLAQSAWGLRGHIYLCPADQPGTAAAAAAAVILRGRRFICPAEQPGTAAAAAATVHTWDNGQVPCMDK